MRHRILAKLRTPDGNINPWVIAITVTLATFMEVLDTSIANVALPLSGWMSSLIGRKRFYMSCVALFTLSSFLCGLAPSLGVLVFFRILQGVGGGGLQPSAQSLLTARFSYKKGG